MQHTQIHMQRHLQTKQEQQKPTSSKNMVGWWEVFSVIVYLKKNK